MSLCLSFASTGPPADVITLTEHELPVLKNHDVRVHMRYAPINPADLNYIEGTYGRKAELPAIPGHEGCGVVIEIGPAVTSLSIGDGVMPLLGAGCWAQHLTAAEHHFARLPADIDPIQASMLRVNPVTAWHLLKKYTDLEPGAWVLQNAANSGVGRATIQIAKHLELKTANFVRRPELKAELIALGADAVFLDDENGLAEAKEHLAGQELLLATNAVGGDSAIRLMELLSPEGILVTYGAMSRRSLKVPNKYLIFKSLNLQGLWITRWFENASTAELDEVLDPLARMMCQGELSVAVDEVIPFRDHQRALQRAQESGRAGKIIFDLA